LPASFGCRAPTLRPRGRLSRAALFAAGAAVIGAEACTMAIYGNPGNPPPSDAGLDTGSTGDGPVAIYGAAPPRLEPAPADEGTNPPPTEEG
jgi:hypothetical protein